MRELYPWRMQRSLFPCDGLRFAKLKSVFNLEFKARAFFQYRVISADLPWSFQILQIRLHLAHLQSNEPNRKLLERQQFWRAYWNKYRLWTFCKTAWMSNSVFSVPTLLLSRHRCWYKQWVRCEDKETFIICNGEVIDQRSGDSEVRARLLCRVQCFPR